MVKSSAKAFGNNRGSAISIIANRGGKNSRVGEKVIGLWPICAPSLMGSLTPLGVAATHTWLSVLDGASGL